MVTAARSETPGPTSRVTGGRKGLKLVAKLPSALLKNSERVPSPALRTTRSSKPVPSRSAAMICAGRAPVASEPTRMKAPSRKA